jgi:hypothetical protein
VRTEPLIIACSPRQVSVNGRGIGIGVREGGIFETASERLAWLNDAVAIGEGTLNGEHLLIELFRLTSRQQQRIPERSPREAPVDARDLSMRMLAGVLRPSIGQRIGKPTVAFLPVGVTPPQLGANQWLSHLRPGRVGWADALDQLGFRENRDEPCRVLSLGNFRKMLLADALTSVRRTDRRGLRRPAASSTDSSRRYGAGYRLGAAVRFLRLSADARCPPERKRRQHKSNRPLAGHLNHPCRRQLRALIASHRAPPHVNHTWTNAASRCSASAT